MKPDILPEINAYVQGVGIAGSTMLGTGNCFSMKGENGMEYRILNMKLEKFREAMTKLELDFPVRLGVYGRRTLALVMDSRIPDEFYENRICEVCCPREMLPLTQRLSIERELNSGRRVEKGDGWAWVNLHVGAP